MVEHSRLLGRTVLPPTTERGTGSTAQSESPTRAGASEIQRLPDFDLVSGGPLYELWRRTRLSDRDLQLMHT